ncbi:DNA repair protein RecO [Secundilactobacillus collinoides]|nr:DNA repair protein RecO [Secundilactobacillus collinoides]KZL42706.1 DNA repair protein RecO [Secundilactobacillus collinoides]
MAGQIMDFNGIVMMQKNYRERDLLVKFFTMEAGKRMFFVRGAKKRGFKMTADLLPFTYGTYVGDLRDPGLSYINAVKETAHFQNISQDIEKNAYATYIMSLLDRAIPDNELLGGWYNRLYHGLLAIDQGLDAGIVANIFEVQLLELFGVAPNLRNCVICGRTDLPFDYSESYGGLLCQAHWHMDPNRLKLDQRTIFYLRQFSAVDLTKLSSIKVHPETKQHLRMALDMIYSDTVGVYPRSKRFIDQMNKWADKLPNPTDKKN